MSSERDGTLEYLTFSLEKIPRTNLRTELCSENTSGLTEEIHTHTVVTLRVHTHAMVSLSGYTPHRGAGIP